MLYFYTGLRTGKAESPNINTGITPNAKWFTLCLPFFQYLFFTANLPFLFQFRFADANLRYLQKLLYARWFIKDIVVLRKRELLRKLGVKLKIYKKV